MSRTWLVLGVIVLLGVLARLVLMVPVGGQPLADPDNYLEISRNVAAGHGYMMAGRPTAYRPPLYPLILAGITKLMGGLRPWAVFSFHLALGVGTVLATWKSARLWGYPAWRSYLGAVIASLDPVLVGQARVVMTETLGAFLVALSLLALSRAWRGRFSASIAAGFSLGLCGLCRPSLLAPALLVIAGFGLLGPGKLYQRFQAAVVTALVIVAVFLPWAVRNRAVFGETVWTTTHGGYTLGLGNNRAYYDEVLHGLPGTVWGGAGQAAWWERVGRIAGGLPEPEGDRLLAKDAMETIRERPRDFLAASAARIGRFWSVAPSAGVYPGHLRVACAVWTVPLWIALALGLCRRGVWRWPCLAAPAFVFGLSIVHLVFWTDMRMRVPAVPAIALIAAGALAGFGGSRAKVGRDPGHA